MPPPTHLDLRDKEHPSCELPPAIASRRAWHVRYATADASAAAKLKARMLREGERPETEGLGTLPAKTSDCGLRRAFHDELGVRKVVFCFCDDMLRVVYRLPAWDSWRDELEGVFRAAGVRPDRVVRCLLAELGAGVDIPVHHDTGYWATRSHRVHVPLITDAAVEFYTGATESTLERVPFPELATVELNNRAKHMVRNKWTRPRVHLIFDWVEDHESFAVRSLDPARDVVTQTRRTITIVSPEEKEEKESEKGTTTTTRGARSDTSSSTSSVAVEDAKQRARVVAELIDSVKSAHGRDDAAQAKRFVREFQRYSMRYSDGEILPDDYVAFLSRSFPASELDERVAQIESLIMDRERAAALASATRPFPRVISQLERAPRFVIIGAMKCGTTSLYEYINLHPRCVPARQKEPHALDWVWDKLCGLPAEPSSAAHAKLLEEPPSAQGETVGLVRSKYLRAFDCDALAQRPDAFSGEATPSYLLGGSEVMRRLRAAAPGVRLLVALRDPVERAYSHYCMTADVEAGTTDDQVKRRGTVQGKSFAELVDEDLAALRDANVDAGSTIASEFEAAYLSDRPTGHGAHSYVGRGLYALQLELVLRVFPKEQIHLVRLEDLSSSAAQTEMDLVFDFLKVDRVALDAEQLRVRHNAKRDVNRAPKEMDPSVKARLVEFYAPHNARLEALVQSVWGKRGVTRGWSSSS